NACPLFNEGLFAPTSSYQTISDSLDAAGDCRLYVVPLTACQTYEFTFCDGGASAAFDSVITLLDGSCAPAGSSTDDACGDDAFASISAATTGDHYVRVSANNNGIGDFTLAYRDVSAPPACTSCPGFDGILTPPT